MSPSGFQFVFKAALNKPGKDNKENLLSNDTLALFGAAFILYVSIALATSRDSSNRNFSVQIEINAGYTVVGIIMVDRLKSTVFDDNRYNKITVEFRQSIMRQHDITRKSVTDIEKKVIDNLFYWFDNYRNRQLVFASNTDIKRQITQRIQVTLSKEQSLATQLWLNVRTGIENASDRDVNNEVGEQAVRSIHRLFDRTEAELMKQFSRELNDEMYKVK